MLNRLKHWIYKQIAKLIFSLLKIRYRIRIVGLDAVKEASFNKDTGILFLPNHPAEMDPIMVMTLLWDKYEPRPLMVEHFHELKGFQFFIKAVNAIPVPHIDGIANKWKRKRVERAFDDIVDHLKEKENILLYPGGRLKLGGAEVLGGASLLHDIIQKVEKPNVVLIRTTGLWGSQFSRALTGKVPSFGGALLRGISIVLKNGIFFVPKRDITIEFEVAGGDFPAHGTRLEINRYLENWFNRYPEPGEEPVKLVSYSCWKKDLPSVYKAPEKKKLADEVKINTRVENKVKEQIAAVTHRSQEQVERSMDLAKDLGMDSLDTAHIYTFLDAEYGINNLAPGQIETVEDVMLAAMGLKERMKEEESSKVQFKWPKDQGSMSLKYPTAPTIQEAFLDICDENKDRAAVADMLSGVLTYKKMKITTLLLSKKISQLPGTHIGIMLPATVGTYLIILSTLLAKKVPVMLNWTVGVRSLNHAQQITGFKHTLTSQKFLENLKHDELGTLEEGIVTLESVRKGIKLKDKLEALYLSFFNKAALRRKLELNEVRPHDDAVILFTSGTESMPKGVPLTHHNILNNIYHSLERVSLSRHEILFGVLPPFHSFGFTVTGLLPILGGMRAYYSPDPTDSRRIAREIQRSQATMFCSAPSFIKSLLDVAKPEELTSLRMVVSGAEKPPKELCDLVKELPSKPIFVEGYGITECSPVVTMNPFFKGEHRGVGIAIPSLKLMTIDTQTNEILPEGSEGEICVSGPSVFKGYLGEAKDPFIYHQGEKWYKTGDRGRIDQDGYLILSGRLKRFVKIGGEMVSLGGLEEEVIQMALDKKWVDKDFEGRFAAISGKEIAGEKTVIVVFTTLDLDRDQINLELRERGYAPLIKITEVRKLKEIPLTGTGKTDYRSLDEMVKL